MWLFTFCVAVLHAVGVQLATPVGAQGTSRLSNADATGSPTYRLYVADYGYHTSIILEQPPESALGPPGRADAASSPFVEYAWGDRRFFMESRYAPWSLFTTLVVPSEAVMYVNAWPSPPTTADGLKAVVGREVTRAELDQVIAALELYITRAPGKADTSSAPRNAARNAAPRAPPHPPAPGYAGRFYPARGRYTAVANCNRWTVERLATAELARAGGVIVTPSQAMRRLVGFSPAQEQSDAI